MFGKKRKYLYVFVAVMALLNTITVPVYSQVRYISENLLKVKDTYVKRILPIIESDSTYADADYTEVHFKQNDANLDIFHMNNRMALRHLDKMIDSLGIDNITAIEIVSQASPDGILSRNIWLSEHRSDVMVRYILSAFPELKSKISINTVTESWENLARYVDQDPYLSDGIKKKIINIIDSETLSVYDKKARLKHNLGREAKVGDVYDYLLTTYYAVIRNSGVYILHNVEPVTVVDIEPLKPEVEEKETVLKDTVVPLPDQPEPVAPAEPVRKRPVVAVKTNLPYYGFYRKDLGWGPIYNVEMEVYPTEEGRWTFLGEYDFPWHVSKTSHECFQILNLQLEARRYFKKASNHSGHYLSAYLGANLYDINFDGQYGNGYQGEGLGGGLGYGYVLPLGKKPDTRWKLEFFVKGGVYVTLYDPYSAGTTLPTKYYYDWWDDPKLFMRRNMIFRWFGPTGVGIDLSYDLIRKKVKNKPKNL